jgi:tight adherence protein B
MAPLLIAIGVFVLAAGIIVAAYYGLSRLPALMTQRKIESRMADVIRPADVEPTLGFELVKRQKDGPLPLVDRLVSETGAGTWLAKLIEQSGSKTGVSAVILMAGVLGVVAALGSSALVGGGLGFFPGFMFGAAIPFVVLMRKRTVRIRRFEEQFPEALDLLSRAINNLAIRMPLLDVRFFVTAVLIQRETGGNLSEILDNLAYVVRERFKILRQVRVYTAHGRMTGYVLLALPAFLAVALMFINPEHMNTLFTERAGKLMIAATVVMQTIGYIWIRKIVTIEV